MKYIFSALLLFGFFLSQAQEMQVVAERSDIEKIEDTLGVLSYSIINAESAEQRFLACRAFIPKLTAALKTPNSFQYPFERLKSISIQYPQDSTFRIFTWQLYVDSSQYRYYGAIQMNTPDLQLIPLIDRSFQMEDPEYSQTDNRNWYGALYYNIHDFDTPEGRKYLLFGYDAFENIERYEENSIRSRAMAFSHSDLEQLSKRKLIDVLTIKGDQAVFGAALFSPNAPNGLSKSRVILEYSAESRIVCNYDDFEQAVIFDHLMTVNSEIEGGRPLQIPDGTFEGYKLEDGRWQYVPKMFHTIVNEPPRENPVLDKDNRNLFGKKN